MLRLRKCVLCGVLFTHTVAYKGIVIACTRNSLQTQILFAQRSSQLDEDHQSVDLHHVELEVAGEEYHIQPAIGSTLWSDSGTAGVNGWLARCRTFLLACIFAIFITSFTS